MRRAPSSSIIARRRRNGGRIAYPMFLLIVAIGLSLTAQLAVAQPTVFGWIFLALFWLGVAWLLAWGIASLIARLRRVA